MALVNSPFAAARCTDTSETTNPARSTATARQGFGTQSHPPERTPHSATAAAPAMATVERAAAGGLLEAIVVAAAAWPPISPLGLGGDRLGDQLGGGAGVMPATPVDHVDSARSDVGR